MMGDHAQEDHRRATRAGLAALLGKFIHCGAASERSLLAQPSEAGGEARGLAGRPRGEVFIKDAGQPLAHLLDGLAAGAGEAQQDGSPGACTALTRSPGSWTATRTSPPRPGPVRPGPRPGPRRRRACGPARRCPVPCITGRASYPLSCASSFSAGPARPANWPPPSSPRALTCCRLSPDGSGTRDCRRDRCG